MKSPLRSSDPTLPDFLAPGLKLVFIGLNPGLYSAKQGKYFARKTNRFWPALSASGLAGNDLKPGDEAKLLEMKIGFTDVVKRASSQIDELSKDEIVAGALALREKIEFYKPLAACFIGLTGFRWVFHLPQRIAVFPGPQEQSIGATRLYVVPSTSPANAHYKLDEIILQFSKLKKWLESSATQSLAGISF